MVIHAMQNAVICARYLAVAGREVAFTGAERAPWFKWDGLRDATRPRGFIAAQQGKRSHRITLM